MYMYIMLTRKFKKNMMGGAGRAVDPYNSSRFNPAFVKYFNFYSKTEPTKITVNFSGEGIYIGFYDILRKITFGNVFEFKDGVLPDDPVYYIVKNDENIRVVNKFKLHIMSIMANYTLKNGHKLFTDLETPIESFDIPTIIKILDVTVDEKDSPTPPLQNDDMLKLNIYREFGIKCTFDGECHGRIKDKFIEKNSLPTKDTIIEGYIRDLYVNVFDYITGSEIPIPLRMNRNQAMQKSVTNIEKAISDIYTKMKKSPTFIGPRTGIPLEFKTLLRIFNLIRRDVNESIFNKSVQPEKLDENVPVNKVSV